MSAYKYLICMDTILDIKIIMLKESKMERVVFYSLEDFATAINLQKAEEILSTYRVSENINDVFEKYHIYKYISLGAKLKTWTQENIMFYQKRSEEFKRETYKFFGSITNENILINLTRIDYNYLEDFWLLFDTCKLYNEISSDVFSQIILSKPNHMRCVLLYKNIVIKYDAQLTKYIQSKNDVSTLLEIYNNKELYLPKSLHRIDIAQIFNDYIDQDQLNSNLLKEIIYLKNKGEFIINDKLRFKAKNRYDDYIQEISKRRALVEFEFFTTISQSQEEDKIVVKKDFTTGVSYSENWLLETLDYPSILHNFIHLFEFVDKEMRITAVSKPSQMSILETYSGYHISSGYPRGAVFKAKNYIHDLNFQMYYEFLKKHNISLECVIEWFFKNYIVEEFDMDPIKVIMPSKESSYFEKCKSIIDILESVIKQYKLFVEDDYIDYDLISFSDNSVAFKDIPSLINHKYIYGNGEDFKTITFLLFSNQSRLNYFKNHENQSSFKDIVLSGNLYKTDFEPHQMSSFNYLIKTNILYLNENEKVLFKNNNIIYLLNDLFLNEVANQLFYEKFTDDFLKSNWFTTESTLLSKSEVSYFNYYLNSKEFSDGYKLRNKYSHGAQQVIADQSIHKKNYLISLRLLVLLIIKINDDLCSGCK